jgi:hypothetical protein
MSSPLLSMWRRVQGCLVARGVYGRRSIDWLVRIPEFTTEYRGARYQVLECAPRRMETSFSVVRRAET